MNAISRRFAGSVFFLGLAFLLVTPCTASASFGASGGYQRGWFGLFGGPTFDSDDDPVLWRVSLRGAGGAQISGTPIAIDGGLALDGGYSYQEAGFEITTSIRHLEIAPFIRTIFYVNDSIRFYGGFGLGHVQRRITGHHPWVGTSTFDDSGQVRRLFFGVELAINRDAFFSIEPLAVHSYKFDKAIHELYSVQFGFGSVF